MQCWKLISLLLLFDLAAAQTADSLWDVVLADVRLTTSSEEESSEFEGRALAQQPRKRVIVVDPALYMGCEEEGK